MASHKDSRRVLTGGMDLLTTSDKIAAGTSLFLQNFRVDQNGQLATRNGCVKEASGIGSGIFHTLKRSANNRYAGIGNSLYYGASLNQQVDTGFDGEPLGIAFYRSAAWVMNRARQSRIVATTRIPWGVEAPTGAPTAEGGGQLTTELDEWEGGAIDVGISTGSLDGADFEEFAMKDGAPVDNTTAEAAFDSENFRSGSGSLRVKVLTAAAVTMRSKAGGDTRVDGQAGDDDVFRVWVFSSNPKAIDNVTVYVRSGEAGEEGSGYVEFSFDPSKFLNQALNSWTQLKIRRRLNLDDWSARIAQAVKDGVQQTISDIEAQFATAIQTPTFVYTGNGWPQTGVGSPPAATYPPSQEMLAIDWTNISEIGVTVKTNDTVQIGVDRAEVIGTVGENSSGAIVYYVTFVNQYEEEGNPSPASNPVIAGNQTITLSDVPTGPDWVIKRYVYRQGGGLSSALQVGTIWDNSTATFEDHTTNAQAQADNIVMPTNRQLPPPARRCIGPVFGKIIAFNSDDHPSRYWWTPSAQPWYFPGSDDDFVGNWEDCGGDEDELIDMTDHKQFIVMYKKKTIHRLPGDPDDADPVRTNANVGAVAPVLNAGAVDYFVGGDGVYSFNGDFETKLSAALDPIFRDEYVELSEGEFLPPISRDYIGNCVLSLIGDRLRLSYPSVGQTRPDTIAILNLSAGLWATEKYTNLAHTAFTAMNYEGPGAYLMVGTSSGSGSLYSLEQAAFMDDGQGYQAIWQSPFMDQGLPDHNKVYTDFELELRSLGNFPASTLSVYLVFNSGTKVLIGSVTTTPRWQTHILRVMSEDGSEIGRTAKNASVRIESNVQGRIAIRGMFLNWYAEERVARSFDTGPTDFGIPERVKQVDFVELYMTGAGQVIKRNTYSDLPGSLLAQRETVTFSAPNGRGNFRRRLNAIIEGRNFRLTLSDAPSNSTYQVHEARARMRTIGEYIDGSIGEYWESPEFSVQPGRVGELKDFLLDYDCTGGNGTLLIYSDFPSGSLSVVRTIVIPVQSRAIRVFPLEDPNITEPSGIAANLPPGQLFKVRIVPPVGGVIRLHGRAVFRARLIGVYFDGTRGEMWETQPLDLLGGVGIFREIMLVSQNDGPMTLEMRTELPANDIRTMARHTIPASAGRVPFTGRLPGNTKGRLQQFRLDGPYVARVFELKVLARQTQINDTPWQWVDVPLEGTPNEWAQIQMPVRETPEAFTWVEITVDPVE